MIDTISTPQTAGAPLTITITAQDALGNTLTSYTGTNTLTDTTGTIAPTNTGAFANGVWTGQVTLTNAGTGITVTTAGGGKSATSNAFIVEPAVASKLVYIAGAGQSVKKNQFSSIITVQRQDQYGNPTATGAINVILSVSPNSGNFYLTGSGNPPPITTVTIPAGSSSVSYYYKDGNTGTRTLTASNAGLTSAQTTFAIT